MSAKISVHSDTYTCNNTIIIGRIGGIRKTAGLSKYVEEASNEIWFVSAEVSII